MEKILKRLVVPKSIFEETRGSIKPVWTRPDIMYELLYK